MSALTLLTAAECHLCEHAKDVLHGLALEWREVESDTPEGQELAAVAPPMRPVLFDADGRVLAYGRLSPGRLRKQLHREEVRT